MADRSTDKTSAALSEDAMLKAALEDVVLPAGLAARLKARVRAQYEQPSAMAATVADERLNVLPMPMPIAVTLAVTPSASGESGQAAAGDHSSSGLPVSGSPVEEEQTFSWLRRSIIVAAVAASICGFAVLARQWSRPAEPRWLASQCDSILVRIDEDNPANWQPVTQPIPATLERAQLQLVRVAIVAQRPLADLGSKVRGTVYRLDAGDGRGIFLMRLESLPAVRGLTPRFEILPTPSGGWSLAAMTVGKETFVLAAACTEQQIFAYIRRPDLT